jgi:ADP-ribosyl-[dinitrogen reductase] hydrolase
MPPFHTHLPDVRDRALAALLGGAIGDALGATVEFMTPGEIRAQYGVLSDIQGGGWLKLAPGQVTDDTQMALCIARSIDAGGWSVRDIAERFATWLKSRPVDVGNTCRRGIRRYLLDGSLAGPRNDGDAGNGAAMRMAPVAIACLADSVLLEQWSLEQGHITHHHPLSDAACLLVGRLLHLACIGCSKERMRRQALALTEEYRSFRFDPYRGLATAYVADTLQTVLHYFFSTRSFEECVVSTVNQGGDADTTGAIVGAIAGAYYGLSSIPQRWLKRLDPGVRDELEHLSGRLVDRSPLARGQRVSLAPGLVYPGAATRAGGAAS